MKNTLSDLNNHLFAQMERLGEESLKGESLTEEINRAKAITSVASRIISNGALALRAKEFCQEYGGEADADKKMPPMLRESFIGG